MWRDLNMTNKKLIRPTDAEDAVITATAMNDPDANPLPIVNGREYGRKYVVALDAH